MYNSPKPKCFFLWSRRLVSISLVGFCTAMTLATGSSDAAPAAKLNDWRFYPKATKLEFTLSAGTTPRYFYLSQPPRLVIDLPDTQLGYVVTKQSYPGAVQRVRVSQLNENTTRIVLDLADGNFLDPNQVKLQPISKNKLTRWVLRSSISRYTGSSLQPEKLRPAASNLSPKPSNSYPQASTNSAPIPNYNYIQLPSTLPPINSSQQQPYITVPPLAPNNRPQVQGSILPPPNFPNQSGKLNNVPPVANTNFPIPTMPGIANYPANEPKIHVIEFGQPLPKRR